MKQRFEEPERIDPGSLGIVESSADPLKTIKMEMAFYRGVATSHYRHPLLRFVSILFGLFLILQTIPFLIIEVANFQESTTNGSALDSYYVVVAGILFSLIFLFLGAKIVWANLKRRKGV